jgi:hypothetical protein
MHRAVLINIRGRSFRMREHQAFIERMRKEVGVYDLGNRSSAGITANFGDQKRDLRSPTPRPEARPVRAGAETR